MKKYKKVLAMILSMIMAVSMMSLNAFATDNKIPDGLPEGTYRVQEGIYAVDNYDISKCITAMLAISNPVDALVVPKEETQTSTEYYYNSDEHAMLFMKACDIKKDDASSTITFKVESELNGEEPMHPDLVYIIDKETGISESVFIDVEGFAKGELPWIGVYVTKEDVEKVNNNGAESIHISYVWNTSSHVSIYPSADEVARNTRLKERNIMVGDPDGNFNPYRILSRAELTKIAVVMSNPNFAETVIEQPAEFTDVDAEHWAYPYIAYAKQEGIIGGYPDGSFKPESGITCAEAAKVFVSLLGYAPFAEQNGGYPNGYMSAASRWGIMNSLDIKAEYPILRSDTAIMACNALDIPLMKPIPGDESAYAIYNGTSLEYPLQTLEIQNFKTKAQR